jgi:SAM-dependent methyltransferase
VSGDYHDYVMVDGPLVGAWDDMYDVCDDPWRESHEAGGAGRRAIVDFGRQVGAQSLLEVGCGLGYFTDELARAGFDVTGMDASEVAIDRARALHPELAERFTVGRAESDLGRFAGVDAFVFAEVTWYVVEHIDRILADLRQHHAGRHLILLLTFYAPGRQRWGTEFFTSPEELVRRIGLEALAEVPSDASTGEDYTSTILFRIPE